MPPPEKHDLPLSECQQKFYDIRTSQVKIEASVEHIKERLDNGMSKTLQEINNSMRELKPKIEHHATVVKRIEDIGWWISKSTLFVVLTSVLGIVVWATAHGWNI